MAADSDTMLDVYMGAEQREAYERLRADAERYRWLRQGDNDELVIQRQHRGMAPFLLRLEKLDLAIDAARTKENSRDAE